MDLKFSTEQEIMRDAIRSFLSGSYSKDLVRENLKGQMEFPTELWKKISELGWLGVPIPEEYGGSGLGFLELVILFEEIGRACFISPIFSTTLCSLLISDAGNEKQKASFLGPIARGEKVLTLALYEPSLYYDKGGIKVRATKNKAKYILDGTKVLVPDAQAANFIIWLARTAESGVTLFVTESDNSRMQFSRLKTICADWLYEVDLNNVETSSADALGGLDNGWPHVQKAASKAALLKSAEMLGGADNVLKMCVDYMKIREQFGHPLGSFQAVQHKCAEMLIDVDMSRDMVYKAAWALDQGREYELQIAMAKGWISDAYRRVVQTTHQLFGAIGVCEEHDLFLFTRHAKACEIDYGDSYFQREVISNALFPG